MISEGAAVSQLEPSLQCWAPAGWSGCCTVNTAVLQPAQSVSQHQNTQRDCLVIKEGASSPEIRQIHCRAVNYIFLYGISVVVWVSSGVTNKDKTTLQFNLIIRDCNARLSHSQWWITNNKLVFFSFHHPHDWILFLILKPTPPCSASPAQLLEIFRHLCPMWGGVGFNIASGSS